MILLLHMRICGLDILFLFLLFILVPFGFSTLIIFLCQIFFEKKLYIPFTGSQVELANQKINRSCISEIGKSIKSVRSQTGL